MRPSYEQSPDTLGQKPRGNLSAAANGQSPRPHLWRDRHGQDRHLQLLAESFSAMGVPVFLADVKGDLAGISQPGGQSAKVQERARNNSRLMVTRRRVVR
jgi:hypothetical protein